MGNLISNRSYRELLETKNVFADPAYCREAWKSVGTAILLSPAIGCIGDIDTREGSIESYTYRKLCEELKSVGVGTTADGRPVVGRQPTELEMIFHCQAARARFDTSAAVFVRDTVGAKPIDESKVTVGRSQYEEMTDDELEALLRYRNSKTYEGESTPTPDTEEPEGDQSDNIADCHTADTDSTDTIASESAADSHTAPIADANADPIADDTTDTTVGDNA